MYAYIRLSSRTSLFFQELNSTSSLFLPGWADFFRSLPACRPGCPPGRRDISLSSFSTFFHAAPATYRPAGAVPRRPNWPAHHLQPPPTRRFIPSRRPPPAHLFVRMYVFSFFFHKFLISLSHFFFFYFIPREFLFLFLFLMRSRISIRGYVRPSVGPSVRRSVYL